MSLLDQYGLYNPAGEQPIMTAPAFTDKYFVQFSDVTVGNTVTETSVLGTGVGSKTLSANVIMAGSVIRGELRGRISSVSSPTIRVRVKLGGVTVLDTGARIIGGNSTNFNLTIRFMFVCRTAGVIGTVMCMGETETAFDDDLDNLFSMVNTDVTSVNTTEPQLLDVTAQWGTAAPGNTLTMSQAILE